MSRTCVRNSPHSSRSDRKLTMRGAAVALAAAGGLEYLPESDLAVSERVVDR
jgi:hypothetical protein